MAACEWRATRGPLEWDCDQPAEFELVLPHRRQVFCPGHAPDDATLMWAVPA